MSNIKQEMISENYKKCNKCGNILGLHEFGKYWNRKRSQKYPNPYCKKCCSLKTKQYRLANIEKAKLVNKKYRETHKEEINLTKKKWVASNIERRRVACRKYATSPRGIQKKYEYMASHKEQRKLIRKRYYTKEKIYIIEKKKRDLNFRIKCNLRTRLNQSLRQSSYIKQCKFSEYIGCDLETLRLFLESKFKEGMTWDNYGKGWGKWCIDHIIPCAKFDLSKRDEQLKCFHHTNLQPLWWCENAIKGAKID